MTAIWRDQHTLKEKCGEAKGLFRPEGFKAHSLFQDIGKIEDFPDGD